MDTTLQFTNYKGLDPLTQVASIGISDARQDLMPLGVKFCSDVLPFKHNNLPQESPGAGRGVALEPDADSSLDRVKDGDDRSVAHNCSYVVRAESAARIAVSGAENVPRHIRAQLLATNLPVRGSFNKRAVLGRNAFAVPPHGDVALPKVQSGGERRLTAEHLNCAVECFHAAIKHERNSNVNTNVFRVGGTNPNMGGKTFAERLTEARKRLGWSQAVLAERAGVSQSTIGNLESGTRSRPRNLLTIASALGVSAVWLEFGTGRMLADNPQLRPDVDELASLMQSRLNEEQVANCANWCLRLRAIRPANSPLHFFCHSQHKRVDNAISFVFNLSYRSTPRCTGDEMNNGDFDYEGAVRQRMADLIEDARYQRQPATLDMYRAGTGEKWRLAEFAIDIFVNEITERDMLAWIANLDDEMELGRLVARELRHALEICVKQEDEFGMSLSEREDLDARATAADIAYDRYKDEQRGLA